MSDIRMIATNANVAFHTIPVTSITSLKSTTPTNNATIAPPLADQPIDNPFGCQMTKISVIKNINKASKIDADKNISSYQSHKFSIFLADSSFNASTGWDNKLSRSEEHTS